MSVLTHVLVPVSRTMMAERQVEMNENVSAKFLSEGQFLHPADGITLFIRKITPDGELRGVFLSDARATGTRTTYTAQRALLVKGTSGPKLVMFDGMAQTLDLADRRLATTGFHDFTYDIGALIGGARRGGRDMAELGTWELLHPTAATLQATGARRAALVFEGNTRFAGPLSAMAAALLGFASAADRRVQPVRHRAADDAGDRAADRDAASDQRRRRSRAEGRPAVATGLSAGDLRLRRWHLPAVVVAAPAAAATRPRAAGGGGVGRGSGGMTLSFYIARKFLTAFVAVSLVFAGLLGLLDMVEQIRRFANTPVTFAQTAGLAALNVPSSLYRILPLIVILATIALFLALARTSELVVIRAAGRSGLRLLVAPVVTALAIGALAVAVMNPIVAATSKEYETLRSHYSSGTESVLSISREGLWLRQGGADGQTVIRATRANLDATKLYNVSFLSFSPDGTPAMRIEAAKAELAPGAWKLTDAKVWTFDGTPNPERGARVTRSLTLPSDLTREQIRDSFGTPSAIPIWELPSFIDRLEKAGFSARRHRVWLQMELALPLLLAAMVLIGAGFTMRHSRFGRTGLMVLLALISGFAIFFLRNVAQALGENGQIPVFLAAWSAPVAAICWRSASCCIWRKGDDRALPAGAACPWCQANPGPSVRPGRLRRGHAPARPSGRARTARPSGRCAPSVAQERRSRHWPPFCASPCPPICQPRPARKPSPRPSPRPTGRRRHWSRMRCGWGPTAAWWPKAMSKSSTRARG